MHLAKPRVTQVIAAPKPTPQRATKPHVARIHIGPQTAAVTPSTDEERSLVIAGLAVAVLLFLLVVAVPSTGARFTAPGRVVMGHQIDLVLAGAADLLVTGIVFAMGAG
jgi:hypothetical protein